MYTNPGDFAELKKRVEALYKDHEKELEEVQFFAFYNKISLLMPDICNHIYTCLEYIFCFYTPFSVQAKRILRLRIKEDQFLDLVTVKTEVQSVCKELYRSSHELKYSTFGFKMSIFGYHNVRHEKGHSSA